MEKFSLIAGDFNAHSLTWDRNMDEEGGDRGIETKRGEMIDEWLDEHNMVALNNGGRTHTNRKTGKEYAPDISIVHGESADMYEWKVLEKLGASDHNPILITRGAKGINQVNKQLTYRWDL